MVPKMALIRGNGGQDDRFYVRDPKKAHPWAERRVLAYFASKSVQGPWLYSELQEPPLQKKPEKLTRFWCAKSRMRRDETPGRIVTNLCTGVGVHDVITCADLYYDRLRDLGVAGGQILAFSIDLLRRPYNTLALPCECVMNTLLSPTKSLHFLNPATITFVNFAVFAHISTSKQPAPLPPPLSILNLITVTISITTF